MEVASSKRQEKKEEETRRKKHVSRSKCLNYIHARGDYNSTRTTEVE